MRVETKLEFKEYLRLMYILTYRKPIVFVMNFLGIALIAFSVLYFLQILPPSSFEHIIQLVLGVFLLTYLPFSVYIGTKRTFKTHTLIQEKIIYEFQEESVKITGETFSSEIELKRLYKIHEVKDWFLLYHNNRMMNIIPKPKNNDEVLALREVLNSIDVKKKLQKS